MKQQQLVWFDWIAVIECSVASKIILKFGDWFKSDPTFELSYKLGHDVADLGILIHHCLRSGHWWLGYQDEHILSLMIERHEGKLEPFLFFISGLPDIDIEATLWRHGGSVRWRHCAAADHLDRKWGLRRRKKPVRFRLRPVPGQIYRSRFQHRGPASHLRGRTLGPAIRGLRGQGKGGFDSLPLPDGEWEQDWSQDRLVLSPL